jgi:uncharacterized protein YjbJ (UPF0337 family)
MPEKRLAVARSDAPTHGHAYKLARELRDVSAVCRAEECDAIAKRAASDEARWGFADEHDEHMEEEIHPMNDDLDLNRDRDMDHDDDLGAEGTKNQAKGNMRDAAGKIQEGFGKLTGQDDVERGGREKQMEGKAQNLGGRVQEGADDALDNLTTNRDDLSRND